MPRFTVDPAARTIRAGDSVWPFDWDPAAGTAAIVLEGRAFELLPLTWRQKCNLARAARKFGPAGDATGMLLAAACLAPRTPLPQAPLERAALAELVRWLVSDEDEVPWEPAVLGRVALDVCRWSGIPRQALDALPVADVEAMWSAIQSERGRMQEEESVGDARSGEAPPPGYKKIVIVPDPDPTAGEGRPVAGTVTVDEAPASASTNDAANVHEAASEQATGAPSAAAASVAVGAPDEAPARSLAAASNGVPRPAVGARFRVRASAAPGVPALVPASIRPASVPAQPLRARPTQPAAAPAAADGARAIAQPSLSAGKPREPRMTEPSSSLAAQPGTSAALASAAGREAPDAPARRWSPAVAQEADPWSAAPSYDPFVREADAFAEEDGASFDAGADQRPLVDALERELERAALAAGIDLES